MDLTGYSFCESVAASGCSMWHIRKLGPKGPMFGGGIDTHSLCGHVKDGWDLEVTITSFHLKNNTCAWCHKLLLEVTS